MECKSDPAGSQHVDAPVADLVTVYWRPGCPYCAALRRGLRRAGLKTTEVNIWTDPEGARIVRSIAGGNETVPTVVVAGTGIVNPKVRTVLDMVRAVAPDVVGPDRPLTPRRPVVRGRFWIRWSSEPLARLIRRSGRGGARCRPRVEQ